MKYPHTPYWPKTYELGRVNTKAEYFIGKEIVITEKIDGSNVMLSGGRVYARSGEEANSHPWLGMTKKYHAWKLSNHTSLNVWGEDIYGVHSIEYDPVLRYATLRIFASMHHPPFQFDSWNDTENLAKHLDIPIVPMLYSGKLKSTKSIDSLLEKLHAQPSSLGGEREGMVIRLASGFHIDDFEKSVCKSVRPNHVQINAEHWRNFWKPCQLL